MALCTTAPLPKPHTALGAEVESPERFPKVLGRARTWNGRPDPPDSYREGNAQNQLRMNNEE